MQECCVGCTKLLRAGDFICEKFILGVDHWDAETKKLVNGIEMLTNECREIIANNAATDESFYAELYIKLRLAFKRIVDYAFDKDKEFIGGILSFALEACELFTNVTFNEFNSLLEVVTLVLLENVKEQTLESENDCTNLVYLNDYRTDARDHREKNDK